MDTQTEQTKSHRAIYLLPNLFTTGALFGGFYAIVAAMSGRFEAAAVAIFVAMVLDGLDGRVARMTHTSSEFGTEYDSLSDMVSFGLAPALVMYEWSLVYMGNMGWMWAKIGWLAAFFYAAAAALRLARFNTRVSNADKRYFQGLPSPSAAALLVGMVWVWHDLGFSGDHLKVPALIVTIAAGVLMVSKVSYYSFKDFDPRHRIPFFALLAIVFVFIAASIDPAKMLFGVFAVYALSGPVTNVLRWKRKRRPKQTYGIKTSK